MATTFKDRISDHPNRRKLTIIQQYGDEMIVDIERADTNVREQGTPFNASVLNEWDRKVTNAQDKSIQADSKSSEALNKATTAESNSNSAKQESSSALRQVNALISDIDFSEIYGDGTPSVDFINNPDGTKKFSFKNLKGGKGDNVHVRYSFDKTSMTEQPTNNTAYIGFYYGEVASEDPNEYSWTQIWGAKAISAAQYSQMMLDGTINPEQVYFIEGSSDGSFVVTANSVRYSNSTSGLSSITLQNAIDELNDKIPTGISDLSEKSYNSLTDRPFIPTSLGQLSERSYNSLTDKPAVVNKEFIANMLGVSQYKIDYLAAFLNSLEYDGYGFRLQTNFIDINN